MLRSLGDRSLTLQSDFSSRDNTPGIDYNKSSLIGLLKDRVIITYKDRDSTIFRGIVLLSSTIRGRG